MNFEGFVKAVHPLQTYTTDKGYTVYRRNIVITETEADDSADSGCFTLRGLDAKHFDEKAVGNVISVCFNPKTFTTRTGRVCNSLQVFKFLMRPKTKEEQKSKEEQKN